MITERAFGFSLVFVSLSMAITPLAAALGYALAAKLAKEPEARAALNEKSR